MWHYKSRLKLFPWKLHSQSDDPYVVLQLFENILVLIFYIKSGKKSSLVVITLSVT